MKQELRSQVKSNQEILHSQLEREREREMQRVNARKVRRLGTEFKWKYLMEGWHITYDRGKFEDIVFEMVRETIYS